MLSSLLTGCYSDQAVIWKADSTSQDGRWTSHAETVQQGGPGNAWVSTQVTLVQKGRDDYQLIASFSHIKAAYPVLEAVTMTWINPQHLDIAYRPDSEVDFQAVKLASVTITLHPRDR
ncbi:hypothetical protein EC912_102780 [Luteibacter rhizovicinus]|uniref:Uncharacterized protein n=1 Tax=Luteibacter rhizovicinus TaxID=242606 RepID=A0A4V2W4R2_9GAMM|nr:hypothetical protein [Luteibacter rhizovicinus]TCV96429.1 hypothetical protein EC912_102780 [Luteibacter rhizovicinus]